MTVLPYMYTPRSAAASGESCYNLSNVILSILFVGLLFLLFKSYVTKEKFEPVEKPVANTATLEEGQQGILPEEIRGGTCHPDCCMPAQWPSPTMAAASSSGIDVTGLEPSSLSCRSCVYGAGCLCLDKGESPQKNSSP